MPWWHSLRLRIAVSMAALSALAIGGVAAAVAQHSALDGRERLRAQAYERLEASEVYYNVYGRLRAGATTQMAGVPEQLRDAVAAERDASYFDGTTMWVGRRTDDGRTLVVQLSAADYLAQHQQLVNVLVLAGVGGVGATSVLSWLIASGLSQRLRRGAEAAQAIADGDREREASQPGRDEVAVLTSAVDGMASALTQRLDREREFSADVAHELRTPVTALVSAAELLPDDDEASALVRGQVRRLRLLVEQLLEVARLESGADVVALETADLAGEVRRSLRTLPPDLAPTLVVDTSAAVGLEPARLDRVLTNLVANARKHGGGACAVRVAGTSVTVTDEGPGYPDALLAGGPRRFQSRGGGGSGLGLVIASRQAEAMGGELALRNGPDGGAQAVLTLRPAPGPPSASVSDDRSIDRPASSGPAAPAP